MIEDKVEENVIVNLKNFNQEQVQEEQISLNPIQDTMKVHQLLSFLHLLTNLD
jgi:hypothetical protein